MKAGDNIAYERHEGYKFRPYANSNYNEYLYSIRRRWICGKLEK
jgi:hypothetical protein